MTAQPLTDTRGPELFARYAYAPNQLGYCGPSGPGASGALRDGDVTAVRAAAERFSGAWPYLQVLAGMTGIPDPLDHRVVESYWLGGGVGAGLSARAFGAALLARIRPQAGHYWSHLTPELLDEAAANHAFHVFGVYPWSRLLGRGMDEHPMAVLDSCRIGWATVRRLDAGRAEVLARPLLRRDGELVLGEPTPTTVATEVEGYRPVPDLAVGDEVALHWGRVCGRLDPRQRHDLETSTERQLGLTNRRLAAG